jgi:hypothetical protein
MTQSSIGSVIVVLGACQERLHQAAASIATTRRLAQEFEEACAELELDQVAERVRRLLNQLDAMTAQLDQVVRKGTKVASLAEALGGRSDGNGSAPARAQGQTRPEEVTGESTRTFAAGRKGSWNRAVSRRLEPDVEYIEKRTGYVYVTDSASRVTRVRGVLLDNVGQRNPYQQRQVGRPSRRPTDDGGHFLATIFRGPGERINLTPMNSNLNRGAWKGLENMWAEALRNGKTVSVTIDVRYAGDSTRPDRFTIAYQITGDPPRRRVFKNAPGGN